MGTIHPRSKEQPPVEPSHARQAFNKLSRKWTDPIRPITA